jgi:hypothetical protein
MDRTGLILWLVQVAFFAGVLWMIVQRIKKDLSGLGSKVRGIQEGSEQRYLTIVLITMLEGIDESKQEKYRRIADLYLDAAKGRKL